MTPSPDDAAKTVPTSLYVGTDAAVLKKALVHLGFLSRTAPLPEPYRVATGIAGKSRVYFLFIPRGEGGINLVAKFDEPARAAREWQHIEELQRLNHPPQAMLPIGGNQPGDGVILYRAAEGATAYGRCTDLVALLRRQLESAPAHCVEALDMTFDALALFYSGEPGAGRMVDRGQVLFWRQVFPRLESQQDKMRQVAQASWPDVAWTADWITLPGGLLADRRLPNPLNALASRLDKMTGPILLSRVHGDLNLTNVLVVQDNAFAPDGVFIIDLANSESNRATATDLARFESEFWHEAYPASSATAGRQYDEAALLRAFAAMRDGLEGRLEKVPGVLPELQRGCLSFVHRQRVRAAQTLRSQTPDYLLYDYFHCLYIADLASLGFASVEGSPTKVRLALLGAALSLQTLLDIESGRYVEGAARRLFSPLRDPLDEPIGEPRRDHHAAAVTTMEHGDTSALPDEEAEFLRTLLTQHERNRRHLLLQKSQWGAGEEPLNLLTKIKAEEDAIKVIKQQLESGES